MRAPLQTTVELSGPSGRLFRLTTSISPERVTLRLPLPAAWEPGRPVRLRLGLADGGPRLALDALVERRAADEAAGDGATLLRLGPLAPEARARILAYIEERLDERQAGT